MPLKLAAKGPAVLLKAAHGVAKRRATHDLFFALGRGNVISDGEKSAAMSIKDGRLCLLLDLNQ